MKLHFLIGFICLLSHNLYAQDRVISGTVFSDKAGQGVAGVLVKAKGTRVQTDSKGWFRISVAEGDTLVFSRQDFQAKELIAGPEDTLRVTLSTHKVVIPYGTADEGGFTGSAVLVQPDLWVNRSFTNVLMAFQGAGTGIRSALPSGDPGSDPGIRIRGTSYLWSAGPPLYIVDGIEFTGNFSDLNPGDIESITVLKDAVNRSLYGRKGLNGVVMINTRTGSGQKNAFDFTMQTGTASNAVPAYNTIGPAEYYELSWQVYRNYLVYNNRLPTDIASRIASGVLPQNAMGQQVYNGMIYADVIKLLGGYNAFNVPDRELIGVDGKLNPAAVLQHPDELNWMDGVSQTGRRNEYNLAYSTGRGKLDVMTSLNYLKEEGWSQWSALERYTGRVNLNYQPTRWFKAGLRATASRSGRDNVNTGLSNSLNPFYFARDIGPIYPVRIVDPETGERVYDIRELNDSRSSFRPFYPYAHPIVDNERISDHTVGTLYSGRVFMNFTLLPWLRLDLNAGGEDAESKREGKNDGTGGIRSESRSKNLSSGYTINQVLTAYKHFRSGEFNFIVGHESGRLSMRDSSETYIRSNGPEAGSLSYYKYKETQESFFMKTHVGLLNRYFLDAVYRKDRQEPGGVSASWSVGGSWRLSRESFFPAGWTMYLYTTYGKLRGIPNPFLYTLPDIAQQPFALGTRFSFLEGRLGGSFEYYSTRVEDLVDAYLYASGISGASNGKQKNSGVEISLSFLPLKGKRFSWSITGNLTLQKEVMTGMPAKEPFLLDGNFGVKKGVSRYAYYIRDFYGVDPETGLVMYRGVEKYDPANPAIKILEADGRKDTVTTDLALSRKDFVSKSALPKGYGSLINSFRYRNIGLELLITYQFGGWVMDNRYMSTGFHGAHLHEDLLNAWEKPGDITDVPRIDLANSQFTGPSTRWLIRSDYINLAGVKLSYRIPEKVLPFMKITFFANAENIYFLARRKGLNPLSFFEYSAGSDTYNFARKFNLGLNIKL